MRRREFALLLASMGGCASNTRERTPTETPENSETPDITKTGEIEGPETAEITETPQFFGDISVEYRSINTAEYLKYRKKDGGTGKLHPHYDYFVQLSTSVTNESDSTINWYADSEVWVQHRGVTSTPILDFKDVDHNRQFDIENLSGWNVNRIQGEPWSQTIEPGESARYYPLFDVPEGAKTLHWEYRGTTITRDPMA